MGAWTQADWADKLITFIYGEAGYPQKIRLSHVSPISRGYLEALEKETV